MRYDLTLSQEALVAIGSVSVQWATLEFYMVRTTKACLDRFKNEPSNRSEKTAFLERRAAFREAFLWPNVPSTAREAADDIYDRICATENNRHKIIHGMANEYTTENGRLPGDALKVHLLREHPKHFFAEVLSVPQIEAIANEIADINGDLFQLFLWCFDAAQLPLPNKRPERGHPAS
jgi:hypothetical protein